MAERAVILATAGYDHTVRFWQAPTGVCQRTVAFSESQVNCIETTPDKQWLAVAGNPLIKLFECHTNNAAAVTTFNGHTSNVTSVGFEKDGKWMFSGSEDGSVKIWDLRAPGYQRDYRGKAPITSVALHPNQVELLCTDEKGLLSTWSLTSNRCVSEVTPDSPTPLRSLSIASDASAVAAVSNTGACYVWSLIPSQSQSVLDPVCKVVAHNGFILQCKYSPDARYLATTAADHTVKLWTAGEGQYGLERVLVGHTGWVWSCAYSADSAYLVTASSDKTAKLWDTRTGEIILDYRGHTKALTSIALNDS